MKERDQLRTELEAARTAQQLEAGWAWKYERAYGLITRALSSTRSTLAFATKELEKTLRRKQAVEQQLTACGTELGIRGEQLARSEGELLALADWAKVAGLVVEAVRDAQLAKNKRIATMEAPMSDAYLQAALDAEIKKGRLLAIALPGPVPQ